MVQTEEAVSTTASPRLGVDGAIEAAKRWLTDERADGTLLGEETLWREAYSVHLATRDDIPDEKRPAAWACVASELVFETGKVPLNQRTAAHEACQFLVENPTLSLAEQARTLQQIADHHNVDPGKIRALLAPGIGYPWLFPRLLWSRDTVVKGLEAILAPFEWQGGRAPGAAWLSEHAIGHGGVEFVRELQACAPERSDVSRMLGAIASFVDAIERESKDVGLVEAQTFVEALAYHGLAENETAEWNQRVLTLREALLLLNSFHLYHRAEGLVLGAQQSAETDPEAAVEFLTRAANIYKRLSVAQMYPERLLERHQQVWRAMEELRVDHGMADDRSDHVLLVSTFQSPSDLQRLLLSVSHELMGFAYGRKVHMVVSDDSTSAARERNEDMFRQAARAGMHISDWSSERRNAFIEELNGDVFPDESFDVSNLAGMRKPGEKGIPYGRLRNFLRLAGLVELNEHGMERPVFTWLDQDNELGALVLTRAGTLSKRHTFNYFHQKSEIFTDPKILVGGGGYTNDALEGVEKFWVAWGILHNALALAQENAPHGPAILSPQADITRFRPWDQPDTLERLPREGEDVETMSDQFLLLLNTLVGTFRGKYDNQVQLYHPWTYGYVSPEDDGLVEEMRAFAGMPGGNTSFVTDVLASSIPFITVGGRGEDIFHLWQLEGRHGPGTVFLTHTPALHTRNVKAGRGDLMSEILDSYNGRIFREPPYLWAALANLSAGDGRDTQPGPDVEAETSERIDGLRAEAKASMAAVSGFAAALEPYVDEKSEFWWLARAQSDPRCAEVLDTLRGVVHEFKDVEKYHRLADEKLLRLEDVKELTAEFVTAYPHWETVVERVGGIRRSTGGETSSLLVGPREGYGADLREEAHRAPSFAGKRRPAEPPVLVEPVEEPPWQEVLTASLLLFRRYEQGLAERESWLQWSDRVARLRSVFDHYAAQISEVPASLWTRLYRDSLLVPHSAPHRAVTELLGRGLPTGNRDHDHAEVASVAEEFGADVEVLEQALGLDG